MSIDSSALSVEAQQVFQAAMRLPDDQREKLADQLYMTIEHTADSDADKAWEDTIARRVAEVENGTAKLIDWEDLRRELQESIDAARHVQNPQ